MYRILGISIVAFGAMQAHASLDCSVIINANGKRSESKIELKAQSKDSLELEAEKEGFIFRASSDASEEDGLRITVQDKADPAKVRAGTNVIGIKSNLPKKIRVFLAREDLGKEPGRNAILTCELKK